jgi:hypothetical protein
MKIAERRNPEQIRRADRIWKRTIRGNPDGIVVRKYTPRQWYRCQNLLDRGVSIQGSALIAGISYQMTWRIKVGKFSFGKMQLKGE